MIKTLPQLVSKPHAKHRIINSIIFMFMLTAVWTSSVAGSAVLLRNRAGAITSAAKRFLSHTIQSTGQQQ